MKGYYAFIAVNTDQDQFKMDLATPGEDDLFTFMRDFASTAGIGRYLTFDMDTDSRYCGYHIFDSGFIKISTVVL